MAVTYRVDIDDRQINAALNRLIALGQSPVEVMQDIAIYGENTTRGRFQAETGPGGKAWKPSIRVQQKGGKTLTEFDHLRKSITNRSGSDFAEWGSSDLPYAAIHQIGGKAGRLHKVTIPARPYLGIDARDEDSIVDIVNQHLAGAVNG